MLYKTSNHTARGKAKKDVGHGGLDEWFSGHGNTEGEATWGDWVAISPVEKKVERELADGTVKEKTVQPGDIVGPCGVSADPNWKDVTRGGKDPLKCMPRQKAHDMPRKERAELAREKMRAERDEGNRGKEPTRTPTFEKDASDPVLAGDNEPTKPDLWEKAKDDAKDRYTKWPSAYAVGHALALYKERGGGWRKKSASLSDKWGVVMSRMRVANIDVRLPATALYNKGAGGWEYELEGFANWPEFLRKPKGEQIAWAKDYVGTGIREPVDATVYADGNIKFVDGHHRVLAGALLGIEIPVKIRFRNFDPSLWPDLYALLKAGYTHRQYNPQKWGLNRSGVPPMDVVRQGPDAADEWIMSNERNIP